MADWSWVSLHQLFGARFQGRHGVRKTALRECKPTSSRRRKFSWCPRTMFWVSKTFSIGIQLRSKKIRVRRQAHQKISTKTRLLLKNKMVQNVFPSDIPLNCHLDKKNFFFIKSQNRQKLSKNDGKTFQRSPRRYTFINWSNYVHTRNIFWKKWKNVIWGI